MGVREDLAELDAVIGALDEAYPGVFAMGLTRLCTPDLEKHRPHSSCTGANGQTGKAPIDVGFNTRAQERHRGQGVTRYEHLDAMARHWLAGNNLGNVPPPQVIPLDCDEADLLRYVEAETEAPIQYSRDDESRGHAWFYYPHGTPAQSDIQIGQWTVTIRVGGKGQTVAYPSTQSMGDEYHWAPDRELPTLPQDLPRMPPAWEEQIRLRGEVATAPKAPSQLDKMLNEGVVPRDHRHPTLISVAGYLRNIGLRDDALLHALEYFNAAYCESPQEKLGELRGIVRHVMSGESRFENDILYERILQGVRGQDVAEEDEEEADELETRFQYARIGDLGLLQRPPLPREWIIQDFIPEGVPGLLAGEGGIGKGFLSLNLAVSLALGLPFGQFDGAPPRGVLLVSFEDDIPEMQRRLWATLKAMGEPSDWWEKHREALEQRIGIVDLSGFSCSPSIEDIARRSANALSRLENPGLVMIDPLGKLLSAETDLNSQGGASAIVQALDYMARETRAAVLGVHHFRKSASARESGADRVTGSKMLVDLSRVVLTLTQLSPEAKQRMRLDTPDDVLTLELAKANYSPKLHRPQTFQRMDEAEGGLRYIRSLSKSEEMEHREERLLKLAHDAIRESEDGTVRTGELIAEAVGLGIVEHDKQAQRTIRVLCEQNDLVGSGIGRYRKVSLPEVDKA